MQKQTRCKEGFGRDRNSKLQKFDGIIDSFFMPELHLGSGRSDVIVFNQKKCRLQTPRDVVI